MKPNLIPVSPGLLRHSLQFPDVPIEVLVGRLLDLDDEQIFTLPDLMYDQVGDDRILANQLIITQVIAKALDHILPAIPLQIDQPAYLP